MWTYQNWYKPEPGEPYRPLIALPSKIKEIDPWYGNCSDLFFTAFDPPRTLEIAVAMNSASPTTTTSISGPTPLAPTPSPTQDAGARKTVPTSTSTPTPSQEQFAPQDIDPGESDKQQHTGDPRTQEAGLSEDGNSLKTDTGYPDQQSSVQAKISSLGHAEPTTDIIPNADPENVSPEQTSRIKSAHSPTPKSQPTPGRLQGASPYQTHSPPGEQLTLTAQPNAESTSKQQNDMPNMNSSSGHTDDKIDEDNQSVYLRLAVAGVSTSIAGLATKLFLNGASINNVVVTPGAGSVTTSGTPVSVDPSNRIHLGGTSYDLPSLNTDPPTTLVNGAVVLPLSNAFSIHGTTIIAGGSSLTISGAALFLDSSNNLVLHESLAIQPTIAGQVTRVNGASVKSLSDSILIAATVLNTGPSPATTAKTPPSLSSDAIAADSSRSPTIASSRRATSGTTARTSSTGLAGLIMGGPGTGGPSTTISLSPPPTPHDTENSTSTGGHTTKGKGSHTKSVSTLNIAAGLMTSMLLSLHVLSL
ncbi:hypothetical protein OEA41_003064 [Lepraria neglecta]|uniref:Uncharacterized protein n=1 Tax=Lepraria neglecta TaxID=209136 RepID=A0AAE0DJ00_9LECA|nr:hypothetical protein OEA41_003064 [Lepraria neglecta]